MIGEKSTFAIEVTFIFNQILCEWKICILYIVDESLDISLCVLSPINCLSSCCSHLITSKKSQADSIHQNSSWLHSCWACKCHIAYIAIYFYDFIGKDEIFWSLHVFYEDLICISIEDEWLSMCKLRWFPYCAYNPWSFSSFSTSNQ